MSENQTKHAGRRLEVKFSAEVGTYICETIAGGVSLRSIRRDGMAPAPGTICRWVRSHPRFADDYARARESHADFQATEALGAAIRTVGGE